MDGDVAPEASEPDPTTGRGRRRWPFVLGGALALLLLLGAGSVIAWKVWLPTYRPSLLPGERYGIDVSAYQGGVSWSAVARSGISFVYIKATEGSSFVDPDFAQDRANAEKAGLEVGAYHFFSLCSSGRTQAESFLRVVGPRRLALPPAVDLELSSYCTARPAAAEVRAQIAAFLGEVEAAEGRAVLYVSEGFEQAYPVESWFPRKLWVAHFFFRPGGSDWFIWQVDSVAHVPGVNGSVDLDVMAA